MKRKYRLLKNQDFKTVLDNHLCVSRENFTIYQRLNNLDHCRVGVSVSSKIGNSVVRHKIKRQVVNMLNQFLDFNSTYDIVIIVRKKYLNNSFKDNLESLKKNIYILLKKEKRNNEE